jgi:hypothetical protein
MNWLAAFALGFILHPSVAVRDIDGAMREPLKVEKGHLEALFFVTYDCPVSNYYSHEIRRICDGYAQRGVGCSLVYTDATMTDDQAKKHAQDYGHGAYPKIVDRNHELVKATGAAITPTAVVVRPDGSIAYRGRIDNSFAAIGIQRRVVTDHDVRDALDEVLAGKPVAKPEEPAVGCYIP